MEGEPDCCLCLEANSAPLGIATTLLLSLFVSKLSHIFFLVQVLGLGVCISQWVWVSEVFLFYCTSKVIQVVITEQ